MSRMTEFATPDDLRAENERLRAINAHLLATLKEAKIDMLKMVAELAGAIIIAGEQE